MPCPPGRDASRRRSRPELQFVNEANDDRDDIQPGDQVILIVENDLGFAKILLEAARDKGFKGVVASSGAAALAMVREYHPAVMTLDIFLPDMQGWRVLERLKADLSTRHIPVCVVSTDEARDRALDSGAIGFISKPLVSRDLVDRAIERLKAFVSRAGEAGAAADARRRGAQRDRRAPRRRRRADARRLVGRRGAAPADAPTRSTAWWSTRARRDLEPQDVLDVLAEQPVTQLLPVVFFGRERELLARWKNSEGAFALREAHRPSGCSTTSTSSCTAAPRACRRPSASSSRTCTPRTGILEGKRALIVDDDMRNIFALATLLDEQGMEIVSANNGRDAIKKVESDAEIDVVLMDIMMPEMDGITTIKEIRKLPKGGDLPIIAVTAKAMKGDREKCIEAGAWDYLSKPVDRLHLLAVLRGWLHR